MSQGPRAVLFDAAGTLIHLREPVGETYARFAPEHGFHIPARRLEEAFGRAIAEAEPMVFPGRTLAEACAAERGWWWQVVDDTLRAADGSARPADADAYFDDLFRHYGSAAAWELAPGAAPILASLRAASIVTGIVSNFDHRLRKLLQELGIHDLFDAVVLPAETGAAKPDRTIFDIAMKRLGIGGGQAVYVGDRDDTDLAGARAAGLHAVRVGDLATLAELPRRLGLDADAAPRGGR